MFLPMCYMFCYVSFSNPFLTFFMYVKFEDQGQGGQSTKNGKVREGLDSVFLEIEKNKKLKNLFDIYKTFAAALFITVGNQINIHNKVTVKYTMVQLHNRILLSF